MILLKFLSIASRMRPMQIPVAAGRRAPFRLCRNYCPWVERARHKAVCWSLAIADNDPAQKKRIRREAWVTPSRLFMHRCSDILKTSGILSQPAATEDTPLAAARPGAVLSFRPVWGAVGTSKSCGELRQGLDFSSIRLTRCPHGQLARLSPSGHVPPDRRRHATHRRSPNRQLKGRAWHQAQLGNP